MPRVLSEAEYTAVRDQVLASAPSGMSEQQYQRWIGPAMDGAIAAAENGAPIVTGSSAGRFLSGAWKNMNPIAVLASLADAVTPQAVGNLVGVKTTGPIQTAKNIGTAQLAQLSKAVADAKAGRYSEMAGHGAAAALPIIGPAAANAGERIASGDVAGGMGEGFGLLAPFGADAALSGARALSSALPPAAPGSLRAGAADVIDRAAVNKLVDQTGPKVGPNKVRLNAKMADIAPDILREPDLSALSREGLHAKISDRLAEAKDAIDSANDSRLSTQQVQTAPIVAQLDQQIQRLTASPVEGSRAIPTVNPITEKDIFTRDVVSPPGMGSKPKVYDQQPIARRTDVEARPIGQAVEPAPNAAQIATLRTIRDEVANLGPMAPYESVRRIREAWDKVAVPKYLPSTAADALKSQGEATGAMKGAGAIRDALAQTDPASAAAYREYSLFKAADDVLTATQEAERARPRVGRGIMARATGAVVGSSQGGSAGAVLGVIVGGIADRAAQLAPTLQIVVARKLAGLADLIRGGDVDAATTQARQIARTLPATVATASAGAALPKASGE